MIFLTVMLLTSMMSSPAAALMLDENACQAMVRHIPDGDVEYQAGVDVHGDPVVEADINASPLQVPETVAFDITVDVLKYAGMPAPEGVEGESVIGRVEMDADGEMTFNGAPMEGEAEAALRQLCEEQRKAAKEAQEQMEKQRLLKERKPHYNR